MNLILLEPEELDAAGEVRLHGRRARHVSGVLRAQVGDRLRVGVVRGALGEAEVLDAEPEAVRLSVRLDDAAAEVPPVELVLAVPRPKALRRVLQTAASLGVRRVDLVNAWRVERSYFASPALAPEALAHEARLGCEQGALTWVPEVQVHPRLMPFLDEVLPARPPVRSLLAHPRTERALEDVVAPGDGAPVRLVVGPEGGWIAREVDTFAGRGFEVVHTGPRILRVETAVPALLAQLELLRRLPPAHVG